MKQLTQLKCILCCASACVLVGTAFAQDYYPYTPLTSTGTNQASKSQQFCRSKDLVGANVKDAQGKKIGDIREIYVNPKNGETLAAIDIGNRRHAIVPVQAFTVSPVRGVFRNAEVSLSKSKSDIESGPTVVDNDWQKLDETSFTQTAYSHYGIQAPSAMGGAESPGGVSRGAGTSKTGATNQLAPKYQVPPPRQPQP
jgi:sporulation protein YlmC with PRC-barrel domain